MNFKNKPILGMIHLSGTDSTIKLERALVEIDILANEGVDGIIVENYHGSVEDVELVLSKIKDYRGYIGINVLPNDYELALKLADKYNADFIQLDYVAGNYINATPIDIERFLSIRSEYSQVKVLGGVWPKYYRPVGDSILMKDIESAMKLADAIVVTGSGTGKETPFDKIKEFRETLGDFPLIIGAGLDSSNVAEQLSIADGAIVGSCFKPYKRTNEMIDKNLVKEFMDEVKKTRNL